MNKNSKFKIQNFSNKPIQYQKGWIEWYKLKFKVTPDVLIPRPETELLVDQVIDFIKNNSLTTNSQLRTTIIDIGTGAGPIAISLAKNLASHIGSGKLKIIATEVSSKALAIAKQNAKFHKVENKIEFIESDLLDSVNLTFASLSASSQDLLVIVTNLPYIPSARIPYLESSVKDYEPHVALDGGENGFGLYRKLFQQIKEKGWKPKLFLGEIDYTHGELAADEAYNYFPGAEIEVKKDLAHLQRILTIKNS